MNDHQSQRLFEFYRCVELFCSPRSHFHSAEYAEAASTLSGMEVSRLLMGEPPFPEPGRGPSDALKIRVVLSSLYLLPHFNIQVLRILDRMISHPSLEVFLWNGVDTDFSREIPLCSLEDFLKKILKMKIEDVLEIYRHPELKKNPQSWVAVTDSEIEHLITLHPFDKSKHNPNVDSRTDLLVAHFGCFINGCPRFSDLPEILKNYPSHPLILKNMRAAEVYRFLDQFRQHQRLVLLDFPEDSLDLQAYSALREVIIWTKNSNSVMLSPPPYLTSLTITSAAFKVNDYPRLKELRLEIPTNGSFAFDQEYYGSLRHLKIVVPHQLDARFFPKTLESLEWRMEVNRFPSEINLSHLTELQTLTLDYAHRREIATEVILPNQLYSLCATGFDDLFVKESNLPHLEVLQCVKKAIVFELPPKGCLKKLVMLNWDDAPSIDLSHLTILYGEDRHFCLIEAPSLRSLIVENVFDYARILVPKLSSLKNLKEFAINGCAISMDALPRELEVLDLSLGGGLENPLREEANHFPQLRWLALEEENGYLYAPHLSLLNVVGSKSESDTKARSLKVGVAEIMQDCCPKLVFIDPSATKALQAAQDRKPNPVFPFFNIPVIVGNGPYQNCFFEKSKFLARFGGDTFYLSDYPLSAQILMVPPRNDRQISVMRMQGRVNTPREEPNLSFLPGVGAVSEGAVRASLGRRGGTPIDSYTKPHIFERGSISLQEFPPTPLLTVCVIDQEGRASKMPDRDIWIGIASVEVGFLNFVKIEPEKIKIPEVVFEGDLCVVNQLDPSYLEKNCVVAAVRASFSKNTPMIIPSVAAAFPGDFCEVIATLPKETLFPNSLKIIISYDEKAHAFLFSLGKKFSGTLYFKLRRPNRFEINDPCLPLDFLPSQVPPNSSQLLNTKIKRAINSIQEGLKGSSILQPLFDPEATFFQKLYALARYCDPQDCKATKSGLKLLRIGGLVDLIQEPQGACRHRALILYVLCQYFQLNHGQCYYTYHPDHTAFAIVFDRKTLFIQNFFSVQDFDQKQSASVDDLLPVKEVLRGALPDLDCLSVHSLPSGSSVLRARTAMPAYSREVSGEKNEYVDFYKRQLESVYQVREAPTLGEILKLFQEGKRPGLLYPSSISGEEVFSILGKNSAEKIFYIESMKDFHQLSKGFYLSEGEVHEIASPLSSHGVVVNWSCLSFNERVQLQSVFNTLRVVMYILSFDDQDAFLTVPVEKPSFFRFSGAPYQTVVLSAEPEEVIEFDFKYRSDWLSVLLGKISLRGSKMYVESPGLFFEASQSTRALTVYNPSVECSQYLRRVQNLAYYFTYLKSSGVSFSVPRVVEKHQIITPREAIIQWQEIAPPIENRLYLNSYNLEDCFTSFTIDANHQATIYPQGWLTESTPQEKTLYITGFIPLVEWVQFLDKLAERFPQACFNTFLSPGASIEKIRVSDAREESLSGIYVTNDSEILAQVLARRLESPEGLAPRICYLTPDTTYLDLIRKISWNREINPPLFIESLGKIVEALNHGRPVILVGALSEKVYHQLRYYFDVGLLHWIALPSQVEQIKVSCFPVEMVYRWNDYQALLEPFSLVDIQAMEKFCHHINKWPHRGLGRPENLMLTWPRLENMAKRLEQVISNPHLEHPHPRHPLKGFLNNEYPKRSGDYAYFNVMFTWSFPNLGNEWQRNETKLARLVRIYSLSLENVSEYIWQILNCLGRAELLEFFEKYPLIFSEDAYPVFSGEGVEYLKTILAPLLFSSLEEPTKTGRTRKRERQLEYLLHQPSCSMIFLKGPPGVGKTYQVRELLKRTKPHAILFDGEDAVEAWQLAEASESSPQYLLLDEANLKPDGAWDALKENVLEANPHKKIFITGNPETFPGRYYHRFFREKAEILYFSQPDEEFIREFFLGSFESRIQNIFLQIVRLKDDLDPLHPSTLRDIQNFSQRLVQKGARATSEEEWNEALLEAAILEFSMSLGSVEKRQALVTQLERQFGADVLRIVNSKISDSADDRFHSVPASWVRIFKAIKEDYQSSVLNRISGAKRGILVEAPPGTEKFSLFQKISSSFENVIELSLAKFSPVELRDRLEEAFHQGSAVSLIYSPQFEEVLNQLLTGSDLKGRSAQRAGFFVFALHPDLGALSPALKNRMHCFYHDPYTSEDLHRVALHHPHFTELEIAYRQTGLPFSAFFAVAAESGEEYTVCGL